MKSFTFLSCLLLTSCMHVSSITWRDNGETDYYIDCSSKTNDAAGMCRRKANQLCGGRNIQVLSHTSSYDYLRITCQGR